MSSAPIDPQQALLATLQQAAFGYGNDLLLAVPAREPALRAALGQATVPPAVPSSAVPSPAVPSPAVPSPAVPSPAVPSPLAPATRSAVAANASDARAPRGTPATDRPTSGPGPARSVPAAPFPEPGAPAGPTAEVDPLLRLRTEVLACKKCKLCETRRAVVFGEGHRTPDVLFVGEAPGAVEDQTGRPFVGPAGQLLDRILDGAMGLARQDVFIANVNKCRPPGNRDPEPDEVAACLPYLRKQVELLAPKVIVALGRVAAHNLLDTTAPMRELRGRDLQYAGIPVVVTWHPAYLLRDPSRKVETWADIKRVNRLLGRPEDPRRAPPVEA